MSIKFDGCLGVHLYFMRRQKNPTQGPISMLFQEFFSIEFMLRKNGTVGETWQLKDEALPEKAVPEKALKAMKVVKAMKAMKAMKAVKAMKPQPMKSVKKKPSKK